MPMPDTVCDPFASTAALVGDRARIAACVRLLAELLNCTADALLDAGERERGRTLADAALGFAVSLEVATERGAPGSTP